jgi:AcrR family transcriptional regulator
MEQNKRQLQKEATRKRILQTAYEIYSQEGFLATTNQIAKEAKIAHGSIFVHFPTVEDLKACLLEQFGRDLNQELHELSVNNSSLEEFLYAHIKILMKHQKFYKRLITESNLLPQQVKYIYVSIQSTVSFHMGNLIEACQKEGKIKKLPVHFIFNTWLGLLHYYVINEELFAPEGSVLNRYKEELVAHFIELIT